MFVEAQDNADFKEKTNQDSQKDESNFYNSVEDILSRIKKHTELYSKATLEQYRSLHNKNIIHNQMMGTLDGIIGALYYHLSYISAFEQVAAMQPGLNDAILSKMISKIDKDINDITSSIEEIKKRVETIKATLPQEEVEGEI